MEESDEFDVSLLDDLKPLESFLVAPADDDGNSSGNILELSSAENFVINDDWIDAVFYRTYTLLYHKFGNMVIFLPGNLYPIGCSPALSENYLFFLFFHQKGSKSAIKVR